MKARARGRGFGDASMPRRVAVRGLSALGRPNGSPRRVVDAGRSLPMGKALGWTVLGAVVPGLGLWRAGRRVSGWLVMATAFVLMGAPLGVLLTAPQLLVALAASPRVLYGVAVALVLLAVGWVSVIGATQLALRPAAATTRQRALGAGVVCGLSFIVAAPLALGANVAWTASSLVSNVFRPGEQQSQTVPTIINRVDPWAEKDRLNILVLGGDSGTGRSEKLGMRTDTVIVVTIDTRSGAAAMFSLPRQTAQMPFPKGSKLATAFPNGWYDGRDPLNQGYWLNAMYRFAPTLVDKDILGKTDYLAEDIVKISVGEALGLDIDYFVTLNMDGFKDVINALGGVTLNVNSPLPIGGDSDRNILPSGWIEPGPDQTLGGRLALWYARGRWGYEDYSRMSRQRCVINAVIHQASPRNVILNFERLASAGEKTVTTDLPDTLVAPVVELAKKVRRTPLRSIVFTNLKDGFSTTRPNWAIVRKQVRAAIGESAATETGARPGSAIPSQSMSASPPASSAFPTPTSKPTRPQSTDLADECAYRPDGFIPKGYPATRDHPRR